MLKRLVCLCALAALLVGCSVSVADVDAPVAGPPGEAPGAADGPPAVPTTVPDDRGVLRLAVEGQPVFDPSAASVVRPTDMVVLDLVYDGLTAWDAGSGTWRPALASALAPSADGLSWTVSLAPSTFSDGSPITAADVVRSFERVRQATPALAATRLEVVDRLEVMDASTVRFVMGEPFALLPSLLSSPVYAVVPPGELDGAVGSGPMVASSATELRPRAGEDLGLLGIDLVQVSDAADAARRVERGELDVVFVSTAYEGPVDVAAVSNVEAHFVLNAGSRELLDPAVRRGIVEAVSRSSVTDAAFGDGAVATDRLTPELLACDAPCGDGELETADLGELPELTIAYVADDAGREAVLAGAVVAELADAGVAAVATGYDLETFVQRVAEGADDLIRTGWVGLFPSPDSQLSPFASASRDNVSAWADPEFDALLAEARRTGEPDAYAAARTALVRGGVVLRIARLELRALVSDAVDGLELRPDGTFDLTPLRVVATPGR